MVFLLYFYDFYLCVIPKIDLFYVCKIGLFDFNAFWPLVFPELFNGVLNWTSPLVHLTVDYSGKILLSLNDISGDTDYLEMMCFIGNGDVISLSYKFI
jgi:hypothetical protein